MTDNEKLEKVKVEIERQKSELFSNNEGTMFEQGRISAFEDVLLLFDSTQEEPVSNDLKEAADNALESIADQYDIISVGSCLDMFKLGAKWQKEHLWKSADGDELTQKEKEEIFDKVLNASEPELIDDSDLPEIDYRTLKEVADEWDGSLYRSDAFVAGGKWMHEKLCSEIERRLTYMQYTPHRADIYKELKNLLYYIKSYV